MKLDLTVSESDIARLTFDPERHEYRFAGFRRPSVTQIITGAGLIDTTWFTETACWRGSVVHRVCEYDCKGTLIEATVDPGAVGYLEAWRACKRNIGFIPDQIEKPQYHQALQYCGTPDRRGRLADGTRCVIDLKTGAAAKWHALQLAGYVHFDPIPRSLKRFTVRLSPDGRYSLTEYMAAALPGDWAAFQGALALHNWRKLNGC